MALKLVIGNKNYSSWSMRPWLALRANNIAFDEVFIPLYTGLADKQRILSFSRSGKVPVLVDGDVTVWDSLAIIEYAAERFPDAQLWPPDRASRAHARSISAEMHSGFAALRNECGMNLHRPVGGGSYAGENALWQAVDAAASTAGIGLTLLPTLYLSSDFGGRPLLPEQQRFRLEVQEYLEAIARRRSSLKSRAASMLHTGAAVHSFWK